MLEAYQDAVTTWAGQVLGLHRLELIHSVRNAASCRAADKDATATADTTCIVTAALSTGR